MAATAPPEGSIVLLYAGRAVAVRKPSPARSTPAGDDDENDDEEEIDKLKQLARRVFGIPQAEAEHDHSSDGGRSGSAGQTRIRTRTLIRLCYYVTPAQPSPVRVCSVAMKRLKLDRQRASPSRDDGEDEDDAVGSAAIGASSKRKRGQYVETSPLVGLKERELGPGLLASLKDDFELTVKLVTVPIRNVGLRTISANDLPVAGSSRIRGPLAVHARNKDDARAIGEGRCTNSLCIVARLGKN